MISSKNLLGLDRMLSLFSLAKLFSVLTLVTRINKFPLCIIPPDFPYICRRMLINGIALPSLLSLSGKKPWEVLHQDTMELWKFGDFKHYTSLDLLAAVFDIPSSKDGMDGSQVSRVYYEEGDLNRITAYCLRDVVVLAQLYLRLHGLPLIEQTNIIQA